MQNKSQVRTLLFDIENTPNLIWAWSLWDARSLKVERRSHMLSFAYKWLGEKKTHVCALPDYELYDKDPTDDYALVFELHRLLDEADVVIGHNSQRFDVTVSNGRFLEHGLQPPSPFNQIDTLKIARRHFKLPSNRLDDIGQQLGVGRKVEHEGMRLWFSCMDGDMAAWARMKKYNKQDVDLLEAVYMKLRPWAWGHPNLNSDMSGMKCPKCGSSHVIRRGTMRTTRLVYQRFQCQGCGAWLKERLSDRVNKPDLVGA